jgi:hypothetical protein
VQAEARIMARKQAAPFRMSPSPFQGNSTILFYSIKIINPSKHVAIHTLRE